MARRGTTAKIDVGELERLSAMQCTDEEIAAWFKVTTRTIERRRKNRAFADVMDRGKAKGRISVRRMQMKLLEQGNATMGVWLGKQILGQTDEIRHEISGIYLGVSMPGYGLPPQPPGVEFGSGPGQQQIEAGEADETAEIKPSE
jgi:hypothetical protein